VGRPLAQRLEILVATAATVWRPAAVSGLPTGAGQARRLVDVVITLRTAQRGDRRVAAGADY
jgi:hypothetical protein